MHSASSAGTKARELPCPASIALLVLPFRARRIDFISRPLQELGVRSQANLFGKDQWRKIEVLTEHISHHYSKISKHLNLPSSIFPGSSRITESADRQEIVIRDDPLFIACGERIGGFEGIFGFLDQQNGDQSYLRAQERDH